MSNILNFPILSVICYLPLIGALIIVFFLDKKKTLEIKYFAFGATLLVFFISLALIFFFNPNSSEMQFVEKIPWITGLGVEYFLGIDGISVLLIMMTTILMVISVVCSFSAIVDRQKEYYICLLLAETGMLGVFISLDFFLFYIFWEIMLLPMYFIIGIWGGPRKHYAAIKFFLYTFFGSLFILLALLSLYFLNQNPEIGSGEASFNMLKFMEMRIPYRYQFWIFLAMFFGFAVKVPMFPFHTWLPDAHTEAPTAGSVILASILLKMGTYGFVRFCLPILPEASQRFAPFMAILAIIGIIYGALVAMAQQDIKKLVAYSSVSHLGFVMLGIFTFTHKGINGSILQMINHGISTGALFLMVGILYERAHTRIISDFGGLSKQIPVFTTLFAISIFSSLGMPGLNNFVGEIMILLGAYKVSIYYAVFVVAGIILGAVYLLWLFQRMMFGNLNKPENQRLSDCNAREFAYMFPLIIFMFWIGLYPRPYLKIMEKSVNNLVEQVKTTRIAEKTSPALTKAFSR